METLKKEIPNYVMTSNYKKVTLKVRRFSMEQLTTELNEFLEDKKDPNKEKGPCKEGKEIIAEAKTNSPKAGDTNCLYIVETHIKDRTRHA